MSLAGRVALVTGANHGIGAATAAALADLGASVAITYLRNDAHDNAPERSYDFVLEADLRDPAVPPQLFDAIGPVDILVNNASGWKKDTFGAADEDWIGRPNSIVTAESVDMQFLVDARGSALMMAEFATRHRARGADWGRIISLTSGGPAGFPGEASYGAAKAALENYTMTASIELAPQGITANVVYPPVTDTGWVTDEVRAFVDRSTDHWHVADPSDVAGVIAWLCTDAARMVTGNVIRMR